MAAPRAKLTLDHRAVGRILTSDRMYDVLEREAEPVLAAIKDAAPVDSGEYRDKLHLERHLTDRAVVRIVAGADYGLAVEARDAPMAVGLNRSRRG